MRFRIRDSYEKATLLAPKIRAYVDLFRPFTLLAPFLGGVFFGLMALLSTDGLIFNRETGFGIFYAAVTLTAMNAGSNAINQALDIEEDRVNKPYRPIPSGRVTEGEAMSIGIILLIAALFRSFLVSEAFFGCCFGIVLLTYMYSDGWRLKKRFILNNLDIALARGFLGPLAGWSAITPPNTPSIWIICGVFALYTFGSTVFKDIPDMRGDKDEGIKNFVTVLGVKNAVTVGFVFMLLSHVPIMLATRAGTLPGFAAFYHFNVLLTSYICVMASVGQEKDSPIENKMSWMLMYVQMLLMMIFFFVMFLVA